MKSITWLGTSLDDIRAFPKEIKREIGYALDNIQHGTDPKDWKPMPSVGGGVKEIRVHGKSEYRTIYITKLAESIYVLHAFKKKTHKTPQQDIEIAKKRLKELLYYRGK